eukprot:1554499-Pyramimonas_sp.AAC.2
MERTVHLGPFHPITLYCQACIAEVTPQHPLLPSLHRRGRGCPAHASLGAALVRCCAAIGQGGGLLAAGATVWALRCRPCPPLVSTPLDTFEEVLVVPATVLSPSSLDSLVQVAELQETPIACGCYARGESEEAQTLYASVLGHDPRHLPALRNLGIFLAKQVRFSDTRQLATRIT